MKRYFLPLICALSVGICGLAGCDNSAQKKARAEQETTKKGMNGNPGNYTPVPLNTSMTPRATPKQTEEPK